MMSVRQKKKGDRGEKVKEKKSRDESRKYLKKRKK